MDELSKAIATEKERYLALAKAEGAERAVNVLHHDLWTLEQECFDTPEGYQEPVWKKLNALRLFSRELWDLKLLPTDTDGSSK